MKKLISLFAIIVLCLFLISIIKAVNIGINSLDPINCNINSDCNDNDFQTSDTYLNPGTVNSYCNYTNTDVNYPSDNDCEDNPPLIFKCGNTTYWDDITEPGRDGDSFPPKELVERKYKSLFEGEWIYWKVLVADSNGIDTIQDIYVTIGNEQGIGNDIEVICLRSDDTRLRYLGVDHDIDFNSCNLRDFKDKITEFDNKAMAYYNCVFTVETPESMYGQYWITVEAKDIYGNSSIMPESEQWFLNPVIAISVNDSIDFKQLKLGQTVYSNEVLISNSADSESGVILDMFISGTDFYSDNPNSYCPDKQKLPFERFKYYASKENFDTTNLPDSDSEGFRPINFGIGFNNPDPFYNKFEILPKNNDPILPIYYLANQIGPDENMKLKLKINVPEQCSGEFNSGNVYIWAEAI